jgi:hypothetical protein
MARSTSDRSQARAPAVHNFIFFTPGLLRPGVCVLGLRPSADAFSLGMGWDAMGLTGTNIGVGEGRAQIGAKKSGDAG